MEFNKYKEHGDYHWRIFAAGKDPYCKHVDKVVSWIGPGKTLDIGCGDGLITSMITGAIGIDDNSIAITLAKSHGVNVELMSVYSCACKFTGYFDNAFMGDVIEHLEHPDKALLKVKKILKTGGNFYVATPPAMANGALHDNYHYREYTPEKLQRFVEQFQFKLVEPIIIANVRMYAKFKKI